MASTSRQWQTGLEKLYAGILGWVLALT